MRGYCAILRVGCKVGMLGVQRKVSVGYYSNVNLALMFSDLVWHNIGVALVVSVASVWADRCQLRILGQFKDSLTAHSFCMS